MNNESKKVTVDYAMLLGLGETIRKLDFHQGKIVDLNECARIQFQEIKDLINEESKEAA